MIDLQEQRRLLDARVQVALDLLEKAQSALTLEWRDPAAQPTLIYVSRYATVAQHEVEQFEYEVRVLLNSLIREESNGEGTERNPS